MNSCKTLPGPCGTLFGAHAHGIHRAAAEPGVGLEIAARFALDRAWPLDLAERRARSSRGIGTKRECGGGSGRRKRTGGSVVAAAHASRPSWSTRVMPGPTGTKRGVTMDSSSPVPSGGGCTVTAAMTAAACPFRTQAMLQVELEGVSHLGAAEIEGHEGPARAAGDPRVAIPSMSAPLTAPIRLWRTFVGSTVALARLAFGRLPFRFPCPGFQPCRLLLGFRELPLAPFETVVRLSGQCTLSAMLGWSGHSPPRHGASWRERGSRQTSCRPGRARPRRIPSALRST